MTPAALRSRLAALGMTQSGFARETDTPLRTVQNWCAGERRIPGWVWRFLDLWERASSISRPVVEA